MEKITLSNGKTESFIVTENDTYKFYLCETNAEAAELNATLVGLGNQSAVDFSRSLGWFVRVRKQPKGAGLYRESCEYCG